MESGPGQQATEPPAPPGLILKANSIDGGGAQTATIVIQGDVQSIRVGTANGLIVDDEGNLNLVKANRISNSTIAGQPLAISNSRAGQPRPPTRPIVTLADQTT